jgi:hypothetical protein
MIRLFEARTRKTIEVHPGTVSPFNQRINDMRPKKLIIRLVTNPSLTISFRGLSENSVTELKARPNILENVYFDLPA